MTKRHIITQLLLLVSVILMAHAGQAGRQKVDRQDSHIDKVVKQQVSYSSLPKNDSVRLWDFSNMEYQDGDYKICYFLWCGSTSAVPEGSRR